MELVEYIDPVTKLLASALLGAVIKYERESHKKPAGLRTHVLVCIASCLITIVSITEFPEDPARLLAQIIPGSGFIGAGSIIASDEKVIGARSYAFRNHLHNKKHQTKRDKRHHESLKKIYVFSTNPPQFNDDFMHFLSTPPFNKKIGQGWNRQ